MKKTLLRLGIFMVFLTSGLIAHAQLPDYSIAPNFTVTDIEGNQVDLYSILDEGKSVILDVSATWCPPCWVYHETHVLEDVYQAYGPNGTDEIVVLMLEGDDGTGMADLLGNTPGTMGNWLNGITYPVIDNVETIIQNDFDVFSFPTLYHVCPNRIISLTGRYPTKEAHYERIQELRCQVPSGTNNAGILQFIGNEGDQFCGTLDFTPTVRLQNLGTEDLTSADLEIYNNGTLLGTTTLPNTLSPLGVELIDLTSVLSDVSSDLEVKVINVNAGMDDDQSNNDFNISYGKTDLDLEKLTVSFTTDAFPCENYWELVNSSDEVVLFGGNPNVIPGSQQYGNGCPTNLPAGSYTQANTTYTDEVVVPSDECYEIRFYDDFGDGICCSYGNGSFSVMDANNNEILTGSEFGSATNLAFNMERLIYSSQSAEEVCPGEDVEFSIHIGSNFPGDITATTAGPGTIVLDSETASPGGFISGTVSGLNGNSTITVTATDGTTTVSTDVSWEVGTTPSAASLTVPADMAVDVAPTPFFLWTPVNDINGYVVEVSSDMDFMEIVFTANRPQNQANLIIPASAGLVNGLTYYWRVISESNCESVSSMVRTFTIANTTSVGELNGVAVDVMPNPTRGMVTVAFSESMTDVALQVFTIDGKLLQSKMVSNATSNVEVNLADYQNGIYILKLVNENVSLTNRVMLNK